MGTFLAVYWPALVVGLGGVTVLGTCRLATSAEAVRLAVIMFGVGVLGMAVAIAYDRYLIYSIHFTGPPSSVPGQTVLALVIVVFGIITFISVEAMLVCLWRKLWTGSLALLSSSLFVSSVPTKLISLENSNPIWYQLVVVEIIGVMIAALLACTVTAVRRRK